MTDRELLEDSAKAAGMSVLSVPWPNNPDGWFWCDHGGKGAGMYHTKHAYSFWNPLTEDGDALRLLVKLEFDLYFEHAETVIDSMCIYEKHKNDAQSATRRAIVRAAAEIGKAME